MNVTDHLLTNAADDSVAVIDSGREHTYADLDAAVHILAGELAAHQPPAGSRVALLGPNSFFWIAGYLAIIRSGHVAVPLSDKATVDDLLRNITIAECGAALVDRRLERRFGSAFDGIPLISDAALTTAGPVVINSAATDAGSDAVLMFTSGTTSLPKAVRVTHANIAANTDSIIDYLGLKVGS